MPENHETRSVVQVASTAGPSARALTPQHIHIHQVIPSSAPAKTSNRQAPSVDHGENWTPQEIGEEEEQEGEEEEEEEDIIIRRNAEASLAFRTQREAESNKENVAEIPELQQSRTTKKLSVFDRAPLADRVSPIESQDPEHNRIELDISSDEGFQFQEGPSDAVRQRHSKAATKRPAPEPARPKRQTPKKVRVRDNVDVHTLNDRADVARNDDEVVPLSQNLVEYERVRESAKQKMAVVPKPPQSRNAWTSVETDMLHYLITEHGTSWAHLKNEDREQGHVLEARDQVALKDKARNMKMDYLKYVCKFNGLSSKLK